ncbi:hypothetical protein CLCR_04190 [Cladophialophora carrionii]|uniref:Uncharacterized protein n=1 Tax=Cladophialophora carrionii TaxID=86049 RepID=A0A1C1CII3_9EURO|nr:hypothetical protein CLCR_04190 [Cladophialophora carrionii]
MADTIVAVTRIARVTAKTIPVSPITAAPSLTHRRELLRRDETVSEDTCGWVNGDLTTFGGPEGYTYLSCTDTPGPTDTMMVTYYGGNATSIAGLPRYFSDYWFGGGGTATDTSTSATGTSTSTSDADLNDTLSWFSAHRTVIIGAIAGFCGLVLLLLVGCCILRRKRASRGVYRPASQAVPVYTMQAPVQEQYPMMQYRGYGSDYQGSDYGRVYVGPNK